MAGNGGYGGCNKVGQGLGDIKEFMIDLSGKTWAAGVHRFYGMPYSTD